MILPNGTRVAMAKSGRIGTVIDYKPMRAGVGGYQIEWDYQPFGPPRTIKRVPPVHLYPLDAELRAKFDADWPTFVQTARAKVAPKVAP